MTDVRRLQVSSYLFGWQCAHTSRSCTSFTLPRQSRQVRAATTGAQYFDLFGGNAVEELYVPPAVPTARLLRPDATGAGATSRTRRSSSPSRSAPRPAPSRRRWQPTDLSVARKQVHVQSIIAAYRFLGAAGPTSTR
jgi:hypothetical protein